MKKIRVGSVKIKKNKNGSTSFLVRTNESTWKVTQNVKPIKGK